MCNKIKIICHERPNRIAYYFLNEAGKWVRVPNTSPLSRKAFRDAVFSDKAEDILRAINENYNNLDRGVSIYFRGTESDFSILRDTLHSKFRAENLTCQMEKARVAVAGKCGVGKSVLISELCKYLNLNCEEVPYDGGSALADAEREIEWYEFPGLSVDPDNVCSVRASIASLADKGISTFVYCLLNPRVEPLEQEIIRHIADNYPDTRVLVALTQSICIDDELLAQQLSQLLQGIRVIPVLAREMKVKGGTIEPLGLQEISSYIFEE